MIETTQNQNGPELKREEFGATETRALAETASSAVAAQAQALVQARYIVALQRPRDWDVVRAKLLKDCKRPGFAAAAIYRKPVGQGIEGPSIRFAEAALRAMGNIVPEVSTIYDDRAKRIVRVSVTDLEANLTYSKDVVVPKTIERHSIQQGTTVIGSRFNSNGKQIYIIEATDDDILNKENALISKAIRTSGLRLLPGDILDEAMAQVRATRQAEVKADPDAFRKRIVDSFMTINVPPDQLKLYLGHDLGTASPEELEQLRGLFKAIDDGEATWSEAMDSIGSSESATDEQSQKKAEAQTALREKIAAARNKTNGKPAAEPKSAAKPEATWELPQSLVLSVQAKSRTFQERGKAETQLRDAIRAKFPDAAELSANLELLGEAAELIKVFKLKN